MVDRWSPEHARGHILLVEGASIGVIGFFWLLVYRISPYLPLNPAVPEGAVMWLSPELLVGLALGNIGVYTMLRLRYQSRSARHD